MKLLPSPEKRSQWWDTASKWIVWAAVFVAALSLVAGFFFAKGAYYSSKAAASSSAAALTEAQAAKTQAHRALVSSNHHHAQTAAQNAVIIQQGKEIATLVTYGVQLIATVHDAQMTNSGTITAIKSLETEVAGVIEQLPVADKVIATTVNGLVAAVQAVCVQTHAVCPPIPVVP